MCKKMGEQRRIGEKQNGQKKRLKRERPDKASKKKKKKRQEQLYRERRDQK